METSALPPYRVRWSSRARQARLTYHPRAGLTVVVPHRYDPNRVPALVANHLSWIRRTEARLGSLRPRDLERDGPFPERLSLRALEEEWRVRYQASGIRPSVRVEGEDLLVVSAPEGTFAPAAAALGAWLARRARQELEGRVRAHADELGEAFERLTIRSQKSRWGSCSSQGTISLNRNLLFLPPTLVRLVLLHEVCHLREMSHSPRFWALLTSYEPHARALSRDLRLAWPYVPAWADTQSG